MIGNQGMNSDDQTIRIGDVQTTTFLSGICGTNTGMSNALTLLVDSNGQLDTASFSRRYKEDIHDLS